jgi:general secretion pathway protein C
VLKLFAITTSLFMSVTAVADVIKTNGNDLGITIMGAIVQKDSANNVALIKESTGSVKAVKRDYIILDKYKVTNVTARFIELITRDSKRYLVYQDKFAGEFTERAPSGPLASGTQETYREDGFERVKGQITMSGSYRDKLVKEDLSKVLMQATAEPYHEGGVIVGFRVSQIDDGSIYAKAGLVNGDIVTAINGTDLTNVAGAITLLKSLKGADRVDMDVRRDGSTQKFSIEVK